MQLSVGSSSKPPAGEEENETDSSSSNNNLAVHGNCNNCNKGSFMKLLEKIWNYQMPPRWIFFFFVLQTVIGIFVTKYFIVEYFRVSCFIIFLPKHFKYLCYKHNFTTE